MWPSFAALTLLDGLLLHHLSPVREGINLIPAILLATFGNLVLVGAVGPWLARRMWSHRAAADPAAPAKAQLEVLSDRVGTGLLVAGVFGILAAGLANRPTIVAETDQRERAARSCSTSSPATGTPSCDATWRRPTPRGYAEGYYRSCIPARRPRARDLLLPRRDDEAHASSTATRAPSRTRP